MTMWRASANISPRAGRRTAGDRHAIEAGVRRRPSEEEEAEERDRVGQVDRAVSVVVEELEVRAVAG